MSRKERSSEEIQIVMDDLSGRIADLMKEKEFDLDGGMTAEDVLLVLSSNIDPDGAQSKLAKFFDLSDSRRRAIMIFREWIGLSVQISPNPDLDKHTIMLSGKLGLMDELVIPIEPEYGDLSFRGDS